MKFFKSFLAAHSALAKDVAVSACLLGGTAGIVFGISAGMFKIEYINLATAEKRWAAWCDPASNYSSSKIDSKWNMEEVKNKDGSVYMHGVDAPTAQKWITKPEEVSEQKLFDSEDIKKQWLEMHPIFKGESDESLYKKGYVLWHKAKGMEISKAKDEPLNPNAKVARYDYDCMVIDGSTHTAMDRSFNQSLYSGLVDFNQNKTVDKIDPDTETDPKTKNIAHSYTPSQDNTTAFMEIYKSAISKHDVVALAGFNHSTPLNALMTHKKGADGIYVGTVSNANQDIDLQLNKTGFILIDSNCPNNQSVASVLFRSDQSGFLTSLATCQYFYNNLHMYHNHYQNIAVGMYGGVAIPTVTNYMGGFQRGIEFFNEFILNNIIRIGAMKLFFPQSLNEEDDDIIFLESFNNLLNFSKYGEEVAQLPHTRDGYDYFVANYAQKLYDEYTIRVIKLGDASTHFSGSFAAGEAIGISKQLLNRGAGAIICVAGPQSVDTAQEIANQNSKCIVIGVDSEMEDSDYQRYHKGCGPSTREHINRNDPFYDHTVGKNDDSVSPEANSVIKFSAIKDMRTVTEKITHLCARGINWDVSNSEGNAPDPIRAVCGPGFQTCGNIMNGLSSISWDGFVPLMQALQHIKFKDDVGREVPWDDAWKASVYRYQSELGDDWDLLDPEYIGNGTTTGIWDSNNLLSFSRVKENGEPSTYYTNYAHTISIVGRLLHAEFARMEFSRNMSLTRKDGKIVPMENESEQMTISDWLDINMYFQS